MLKRKTEEERAAEETEQRRRDELKAMTERANQTHVANLPKWEYQVKRIGEDKQKGMLGSQRMEAIFNGEGEKGWELVAINEERATFKRLRASSGEIPA